MPLEQQQQKFLETGFLVQLVVVLLIGFSVFFLEALDGLEGIVLVRFRLVESLLDLVLPVFPQLHRLLRPHRGRRQDDFRVLDHLVSVLFALLVHRRLVVGHL